MTRQVSFNTSDPPTFDRSPPTIKRILDTTSTRNSVSGISDLKTGGADIAQRRMLKFRQIMLSTVSDDISKESPVRRRAEIQSDNLVQIIQSCESLRESYQSRHDEWRKSIEREQEDVQESHMNLRKRMLCKKYLVLKPEHHTVLKKVLPQKFKEPDPS